MGPKLKRCRFLCKSQNKAWCYLGSRLESTVTFSNIFASFSLSLGSIVKSSADAMLAAFLIVPLSSASWRDAPIPS